jgi:hypothetical protein
VIEQPVQTAKGPFASQVLGGLEPVEAQLQVEAVIGEERDFAWPKQRPVRDEVEPDFAAFRAHLLSAQDPLSDQWKR